MNENRESMMRRFSVHSTAVELKSEALDEIAQQIAAFVAAGGVIREAATGQSTDFDPSSVYRNYPPVDALNSNDHSLPFAAKYLNINERKLHRLILAGKGPVHIVVRRGEKDYYRFRMADLTDFKNKMESGE